MESLDSLINIGIPSSYTGHVLKIICGKWEAVRFTRGVVECSIPGELKCIPMCISFWRLTIWWCISIFHRCSDFFPLLLLNKHFTWLSVQELTGEAKDWLAHTHSFHWCPNFIKYRNPRLLSPDQYHNFPIFI